VVIALIGRIWPLLTTSCPNSLLTTHYQSLITNPSAQPVISILIGIGVMCLLDKYNESGVVPDRIRKTLSSKPCIVTTITRITRHIPEAASVALQAARPTNPTNSAKQPSVAFLQMARRVLLGSRVALKGSLSAVLEDGVVGCWTVARVIPSQPEQGIMIIGKSTKVTFARGAPLPESARNPQADPLTTGTEEGINLSIQYCLLLTPLNCISPSRHCFQAGADTD